LKVKATDFHISNHSLIPDKAHAVCCGFIMSFCGKFFSAMQNIAPQNHTDKDFQAFEQAVTLYLRGLFPTFMLCIFLLQFSRPLYFFFSVISPGT